MVGRAKKTSENVEGTPPTDMQPSGSSTTPGSAQGAEELSFGEQLKAGAAGQQIPTGGVPTESPALTDEQALAEDPNTDPELAEEAGEPMVIYRGTERREISAADWRGAGVEGMPTVLWERQRNYAVPKSVFTEQALQVLRQDGNFEIQ